MIKNVWMIVLCTLLFTGCRTVPADGTVAAEQPVVASAVPSEMPLPTATPLATETPFPAATDLPPATPTPPDLTASFDCPSRVIPNDIDPMNDIKKMIQGYNEAVQNDAFHLKWYGAVVSTNNIFFIWVSTLSKDKKEKIELNYPLKAIITRTDIPAGHINVASPLGGGGGGYVQEMQPFVLEPGQIKINTKDETREEMRYDTMMDIGHSLPFTCAQSGVYNIHLEFSYRRYRDSGETYTNVFPYDVMFACPESFTQFLVDNVSYKLQRKIEWSLEDGEYIQQP